MLHRLQKQCSSTGVTHAHADVILRNLQPRPAAKVQSVLICTKGNQNAFSLSGPSYPEGAFVSAFPVRF